MPQVKSSRPVSKEGMGKSPRTPVMQTKQEIDVKAILRLYSK